MKPHADIFTLEQMLLRDACYKSNPINGSVELLPLCNMNCDMCYVRMSHSEMEKRGKMRTAEEWLSLGHEMQHAGVLFLLLTGGEPLLYPEFKEVYLGFRKLGMIITLNTNGTLLNESWANFFAENKPRRINITLYGADRDAYGRICHYPEGFGKTLEAVRLLRDRDIDVRLNCSVTPDNVDSLVQIQAIAKELDVPILFDYYMLPATRERITTFKENSRLTPEQAAQAELKMKRLELGYAEFHQVVLKTVDDVTQYIPQNSCDGLSCMAGSCSFAINWQGELHPCVITTEPTASVFEEGFLPAWKKVSHACRAISMSPQCVACKLRSLCRTCAISAHIETGHFDGVPNYLCRYTNEYWHLIQEEACHG